MLILATAFPVEPQTCPAPGSGAAGVNEFKANCTNCTKPATTCNGEFSIDLESFARSGSLVTLTYEVCKLGTEPTVKDLSYWSLALNLGLEQLTGCLAADEPLTSVLASCSITAAEGSETCELSQPDPNTQLAGVKFEATVGDGQCRTFTLTLNELALTPGSLISEGCTVAATKTGNQDIKRADRPSPGYACVQGPVCGVPNPPMGNGGSAVHEEPTTIATLGIALAILAFMYRRRTRIPLPVSALKLVSAGS